MEGYGLKYTGTFSNTHDTSIRVDILRLNWTGDASTLLLYSDPVTISAPIKDKLEPVCGAGATVMIVNKTGDLTYYNDLVGTPLRSHYLRIIKESDPSVYLFEGYVIPEMYTQEVDQNVLVNIVANNALSDLVRYDPSTIKGNPLSYVQVIDVIKDIIWSTGITNPIYIKNTLYCDQVESSYSPDTTPFDDVYLDKQLFIDGGKYVDGLDVLSKILKTFYCRIYYLDKKWVIDRIKDMSSSPVYRVYTYDGSVYTTSVTPKFNSIDEDLIIRGGSTITYESGKNVYACTLDFKRYTNLVNPLLEPFRDVSIGNMFITTPRYEWRTWPLPGGDYTSNNIISGISYVPAVGMDDYTYMNTPITAYVPVDLDSATTINVKYTHERKTQGQTRDQAWEIYRSGFRLRYQIDSSTWRYVARDPDDASTNTFRVDASAFPVNYLNDSGEVYLRWVITGVNLGKWQLVRRKSSLIETSVVSFTNRRNFNDFTFGGSPFGTKTLKIREQGGDILAIGVNPSTLYGTWAETPDTYKEVCGFYKLNSTAQRADKISLSTIKEVNFESVRDNGVITVNDTVSLGELSAIVEADFGYLPRGLDLYLDIMPQTTRISTASSLDENRVRPITPSRVGDPAVGSQTSNPPNYITGTINQDFTQDLNFSLSLFDTDLVNFKNSIYYLDNNNIYRRTMTWSDASINYERPLHELLINNLVQQYNDTRYRLNTDVKLKNEGEYSMDSLFGFNKLGSKNFICVGWDLNVKDNVYRLMLGEYKPEDGWLFDDLDSSLSIDPSAIVSARTQDFRSIAVTSRTPWNVDVTYTGGSSFWLGIDRLSGSGNGYINLSLFEVSQDSSSIVHVSTWDTSTQCLVTRQAVSPTPFVTLSKSTAFKGGTTWCAGAGTNNLDVSCGATIDWVVGISRTPVWDEFGVDISANTGTGPYTNFGFDFSEAYPGYTRTATLTFFVNSVPQQEFTMTHGGGCV